MATGIALPAKAENGRLAMLSGDDYIKQLVMTVLGDVDSENPFQDIGLGEFMIFGINSGMLEGEIRATVEARFKSLEADQLARLESLNFERNGEKLIMFLEYRDLESGQRSELDVPIPE